MFDDGGVDGRSFSADAEEDGCVRICVWVVESAVCVEGLVPGSVDCFVKVVEFLCKVVGHEVAERKRLERLETPRDVTRDSSVRDWKCKTPEGRAQPTVPCLVGRE